ncbi:FAD-binding oxidoreductase [Blastococcus brunescens]|uniref:FAD-binding oxidoreductase n=1 Tax=Blastococcus brunescens TaxID=1564165 RepID=A0ABZ1AT42_9ACTN|nr:FAD-binding oxidoreductase [Blastococcus sp. BMG 8361]WRL61737.1 FAD-binding oxidoreductase [Blastococcus sp. BMG 8361]
MTATDTPLTTSETGLELVAALRAAGIADVDDSGLARALYSSDASLYRVLPRAVVRPRHVDEMVATLEVCRSLGVPLTARGAGTSIAGNAVGPGVVLDTSRYLSRVHEIDVEARTATVDPGLVQAALQTAVRPHGLRFGPDPSTHNRCTVGGMIGNNACGSRALGYGRTSDNVVGLDVVTGAGTRLRLGPTTEPADGVLGDLHALVAAELALVRTELGRFGRQVSGYSLEHLLPERGFDVARALVGSEGTLALVLGATVRLVTDAPFRGLVVLGYPSMADAADATPGLLPTSRPPSRGSTSGSCSGCATCRPPSSPTCPAATAG